MDDQQFGRAVGLLRRRADRRQEDTSAEAGVSQSTWSRIESGQLGSHSIDTLRAVAGAVDARLTLELRWHGAALDRLLDERHAALSDDATEWLRGLGWAVAVEVTYSRYGERGSVDILASRADVGTCLVVELKTEIVSIEELVRRLDAKSRLGGTIHFEQAGWRPRQVARLVIVLEGSTNRRRVRRHAQALDAAFPDRTDRVKTWLRNPVGPLSGLVFMSSAHHRNAGSPVVRPTRVQRPRPAVDGRSPRTNPGPMTARQDPGGTPIDPNPARRRPDVVPDARHG